MRFRRKVLVIRIYFKENLYLGSRLLYLGSRLSFDLNY